MALIKCPECGKTISDKAEICPSCGFPISSKKEEVTIRFPICEGQLLNTACYVYDKKTKKIIVRGRQGETVSFKCKEPMHIYIVVKGAFGKPETTVMPGDKFDVGYRGWGSVYLSKVDTIAGSANVYRQGR